MGWNAGTLTPLSNAALINRQPKHIPRTFLSSIWMSGFGLAADAAGSLYFVTGNSAPSGTTYDADVNLAESVVKLSPDLATVQDYFTPGGAKNGEAELDIKDLDLGSGGIMLLPKQPTNFPDLAVAAGKSGVMYLLDRGQLGAYVPNGPNNDVGEVAIETCYCGPSYFTGPDGAERVVSSGNSKAIGWRVRTKPSTSLVAKSKIAPVAGAQTMGFFTSVSPNGQVAGTAVIWAVARPAKTGTPAVTLLAYNPSGGATLFSASAGPWPNPGNANLVPVVANGFVYVASCKQLAIFGMASAAARLYARPR